MVDQLIAPYGGTLINLIDPGEKRGAQAGSPGLPSLDLGWRQQCELEMLMRRRLFAAFRIHDTARNVRGVVADQQLDDGSFWPLPVHAHQASKRAAADLKQGDRVALRDGEGFMLAVLTVGDGWEDNGTWHLGGAVEGAALPPHPDFSGLRATPSELRALFARRGWRRVIAWQAHHPIAPRAVRVLPEKRNRKRSQPAAASSGGRDITEAPGYFGLVRSFLAIRERFPAATPSCRCCRRHRAKRVRVRCCCAPSSRVITACSLLIAGGEHQPNGNCRRGEDLTRTHADLHVTELAVKVGVRLIAYPRMVYVEDAPKHLPESEAPEGTGACSPQRRGIPAPHAAGLKIPDWYSFPKC